MARSGATRGFQHLHSFHCAGRPFRVWFRTEACCEAPQFLTALEMQSASFPQLIFQRLALFLRSLERTQKFWIRYRFKFSRGRLKKQAEASPWIRDVSWEGRVECSHLARGSPSSGLSPAHDTASERHEGRSGHGPSFHFIFLPLVPVHITLFAGSFVSSTSGLPGALPSCFPLLFVSVTILCLPTC